jgi:hypothetical protein
MLATSPNGYSDDQIALEWLGHFIKCTIPVDPLQKRLLLVDNHGSHLTIEFFQMCQDNAIVLFPLPPKTTHKLQPLDVGVFQSYKHFHQMSLLRQINYGAVDYNKVDFLNGLYFIRKRTFKKQTILSAWAKCGLRPFKPAVVLDKLEDPLTSALAEDIVTKKIGYIADSWEHLRTPSPILDKPPAFVIEEFLGERYIDWATANTPPLNLYAIGLYDGYILERIERSINCHMPLTPTVQRVAKCRDKAKTAMAKLAVEQVTSLRKEKKAQIRREVQRRDGANSLITRFGPITADDSRLRAATDEYGRNAAKDAAAKRLAKKDRALEQQSLTRWVRGYTAQVRRDCKQERAKLAALKWKRIDIRAKVNPVEERLSDFEWLTSLYRRERQERQEYYLVESAKELQARADEVGRPISDVKLEYNWEPPGDPPKPETPWRFNSVFMDEVINDFLNGQFKGEDDEALDQEVIDLVGEEVEDQDQIDLSLQE